MEPAEHRVEIAMCQNEFRRERLLGGTQAQLQFLVVAPLQSQALPGPRANQTGLSYSPA